MTENFINKSEAGIHKEGWDILKKERIKQTTQGVHIKQKSPPIPLNVWQQQLRENLILPFKIYHDMMHVIVFNPFEMNFMLCH